MTCTDVSLQTLLLNAHFGMWEHPPLVLWSYTTTLEGLKLWEEVGHPDSHIRPYKL